MLILEAELALQPVGGAKPARVLMQQCVVEASDDDQHQ